MRRSAGGRRRGASTTSWCAPSIPRRWNRRVATTAMTSVSWSTSGRGPCRDLPGRAWRGAPDLLPTPARLGVPRRTDQPRERLARRWKRRTAADNSRIGLGFCLKTPIILTGSRLSEPPHPPPHTLSAGAVIELLGADAEHGLSESRVDQLRARHGPN